jgi:hypothetical protein
LLESVPQSIRDEAPNYAAMVAVEPTTIDASEPSPVVDTREDPAR